MDTTLFGTSDLLHAQQQGTRDYIGGAVNYPVLGSRGMRRRKFLSGITAASISATTMSLASSKAHGANDRVRIAVIGCGGRGRYVAERLAKVENVEIVAAADVYEWKWGRLHRQLGIKCDVVSDFRRVLDRKDIDGVLVATPDHWHAIPTVLACQAEKDVYVEKPLAHNIVEGRAMVDAARKHSRVAQTGLQQRSAPHFERARKLIADGRIGNVRYVRVWNFKNTSPGKPPAKSPAKPPAGLDWDMFLGPAPFFAYDENRYEDFRRYWDYAGGIATNYGTHRLDSVRHMLSLEGQSPKTVSASGHRFEVHDGSEDPDVVQMTFEFDDFVMSYEGCMMNAFGSGVRTPSRPYYHMLGQKDRPHGIAIYGTKGSIFADRLGFELYPELKKGERTDRIKPEETNPRCSARPLRTDDRTSPH